MTARRERWTREPVVVIRDGRTLIMRRTYMVMKAFLQGTSVLVAHEAVATVALSHPEWNMSELRTFAEWEQSGDDCR
jgi:hypothetical protein